MPTSPPLTLAELHACRSSIVECIREAQQIADLAVFELRTLKAALVHIEELIRNFESPDDKENKPGGSLPNKSAA